MSWIMNVVGVAGVFFLLGAGFVFGLAWGTTIGMLVGRWIYAKLTKAEKVGQPSLPYKIGCAE
jgi:hypothetical protein